MQLLSLITSLASPMVGSALDSSTTDISPFRVNVIVCYSMLYVSRLKSGYISCYVVSFVKWGA